MSTPDDCPNDIYRCYSYPYLSSRDCAEGCFPGQSTTKRPPATQAPEKSSGVNAIVAIGSLKKKQLSAALNLI